MASRVAIPIHPCRFQDNLYLNAINLTKAVLFLNKRKKKSKEGNDPTLGLLLGHYSGSSYRIMTAAPTAPSYYSFDVYLRSDRCRVPRKVPRVGHDINTTPTIIWLISDTETNVSV